MIDRGLCIVSGQHADGVESLGFLLDHPVDRRAGHQGEAIEAHPLDRLAVIVEESRRGRHVARGLARITHHHGRAHAHASRGRTAQHVGGLGKLRALLHQVQHPLAAGLEPGGQPYQPGLRCLPDRRRLERVRAVLIDVHCADPLDTLLASRQTVDQSVPGRAIRVELEIREDHVARVVVRALMIDLRHDGLGRARAKRPAGGRCDVRAEAASAPATAATGDRRDDPRRVARPREIRVVGVRQLIECPERRRPARTGCRGGRDRRQ